MMSYEEANQRFPEMTEDEYEEWFDTSIIAAKESAEA